MSEPSRNISVSDVWLALNELPRPSRLVDFPRNDPATGESIGKIAMWVLTHEEQMICISAADKLAKEMLRDKQAKDDDNLGYKDLYNNAASVEVLFRACRNPSDLKLSAFPSPTELRKKLTVDEIGVLMRNYMQLQYELGPIIAHMSEPDLDAWVRRLGEGGSAFPLDLLSSEARNDLVMHMALRLCTSPMVNTSVGSRPDVSL